MFRRYYENPTTIRLGYDFYADIAERIVERRKAVGLTQAQLEKKANLPSGKIAKAEAICGVRIQRNACSGNCQEVRRFTSNCQRIFDKGRKKLSPPLTQG